MTLLSCGGAEARAQEVIDPQLERLAARATKKRGWPPLRRYAGSAQGPERKGLAYFVLGYRQYEAGDYRAAESALREAASTDCSLADYAEYYWSATTDKLGHPGRVLELLEGFADRHPRSAIRLEALELLARAYLETNRPELAIQILSAEGRARENPSLGLLLARAYLKAQNVGRAVRGFQEIYYFDALAPEAQAASEALVQLKARLGPDFPQATEEIQTARADSFLNKSKDEEALGEYGSLLSAMPASPLRGRWELGRARCLLHLRRTAEAVESLESLASTSLEVDAERLRLLVEAEARLGERDLMLEELARLKQVYPDSHSYASALSSASSFFARRGDWEGAAHYDRILVEEFPQLELAREAAWRVAWSYYRSGQADEARRALVEHLTRFPYSPYVPRSLYWLGRLAEQREQWVDARGLYDFLSKRYAHSYYALLARRRVEQLPSVAPASATSEDSSLELTPAALERMLPPVMPPPIRPCTPLQSDPDLRTFEILKALGLDGPADQFLEAKLSEFPTSPSLLLTLSKSKAEQDDSNESVATAKKIVPNYSEYQFDDLPEEVWELLYPQTFRKLVEREARASRVDPNLVLGLIRQESGFNPQAISWANARGLMQILPETVSSGRRRRRIAARRLYDPAYNVRFGCKFLRQLVGRYRGNLEQALAAYHAGVPNVETWRNGRQSVEPGAFLEAIAIPGTRVYVEAVLRDAEVYRQLRAGAVRFKKCDQETAVAGPRSIFGGPYSALERSGRARAGRKEATISDE